MTWRKIPALGNAWRTPHFLLCIFSIGFPGRVLFFPRVNVSCIDRFFERNQLLDSYETNSIQYFFLNSISSPQQVNSLWCPIRIDILRAQHHWASNDRCHAISRMIRRFYRQETWDYCGETTILVACAFDSHHPRLLHPCRCSHHVGLASFSIAPSVKEKWEELYDFHLRQSFIVPKFNLPVGCTIAGVSLLVGTGWMMPTRKRIKLTARWTEPRSPLVLVRWQKTWFER